MPNDQNTSYLWDQPPIDNPQEGLLPPGVYPFTVLNFARGRYEPGPNAKLPPCNKAIVKVRVDGGDFGSFTKDVNLFLHSRCEGILAAFFASIGLRKHGEPLDMQWTKIIGRTGHCKTKHQQGIGDKANRSYNDIAAWLYRDDVKTVQIANVTPAALDLEVLRHLRTCDAGATVNDLCRGLCVPYNVIARCELAGWLSVSQDLMATLTDAGRKLLK